jgi:hypothetical protein
MTTTAVIDLAHVQQERLREPDTVQRMLREGATASAVPAGVSEADWVATFGWSLCPLFSGR